MSTAQHFVHQVRSALTHLYDPEDLRRSPLAVLFGVADRADTPMALRRVLTEAIESLNPGVETPPQSSTWRLYDVLFYRYVQQCSQKEVAEQLGVSARHLRREQARALQALAAHLRAQFNLEDDVGTPDESPQAAEHSPSVGQELASLQQSLPDQPAALAQVVPTVMELVKPLAARHSVHLESSLPDDLPDLAVHPVVLRQALLSLLSAAIPRVPGGRVRLSAEPDGWEVRIEVRAMRLHLGSDPVSRSITASLGVARQLAALNGGEVSLLTGEAGITIALTLSAAEQIPVLAIDDNLDILGLLQRYVSGSRYTIVPAQDPEQALIMAVKSSPQLIILDVMMPEVDGWELLGRLRQHPETSHVPVIVCTILAQRELALSLGASDFVQKPISRQDLLAVLGRQLSARGTTPH